MGAGIAVAVLTGSAAFAQDAAVSDPGLYKVIFENDRVRVLRSGWAAFRRPAPAPALAFAVVHRRAGGAADQAGRFSGGGL